MRGCLFVLIVGAAFVAAAAWFGSPLLASSLISTALTSSGVQARSMTVTATSDPPPKLLLGRADRVEIIASDVDYRTFHATSLDLVFSDVDVLKRTATTISGRIIGAALVTGDGASTSTDISVDGAADKPNASIVVSGETVDAVIRAAFQKRFGVAVTKTRLVAPDILRIGALGQSIDGHLTVDANGAIALTTPLGTAPIVSLDSAFPLRFTSVRVEGGDLHITATLNAETLLGGS